MLQITIPAIELFDDDKQEFLIGEKEQILRLEHSLVSLSKWESTWCKPYFTKQEKTPEEILDYIRCMTITQNVKPETYYRLTEKNIKEISDYINAPMTATFISNRQKGSPNREQVTAELIYYWMIALNIPKEFEKWHLNRLIMLINVCSVKNQPQKKMSQSELIEQQATLNAQRRKLLNSKG
jgi:hypothetical protein